MDQNLLRIIPFVKPYKRHVILNITYNTLYALFSTISMLTLLPMLEVLFKNNQIITDKPVWHQWTEIGSYSKDLLYYYMSHLQNDDNWGPQYALLLAVSLVIITFLFKNLFSYLASYHITHLKNGVLSKLRITMYNKIIGLPIPYFSEKRKGDLMARMLGDLAEVQNSFFSILELIIKEPLTIVFSIVAMLNISLKLTLFVFVFIPISGLVISRIGKTLKAKSLRAQQESGLLISLVEETLSGLKVVKGYNAETIFKNRFNDLVQRILNLSNAIGNKNNLASPMSEFLGIVTIAVLLWYGGNLVLVDKTLDGSLFIVYMSLAYNILTPAKSISKASYSVKNGMAAAERVFEVLEVENSVPESADAIELPAFSDCITMDHVSFKYESDWVLRDFNLKIPRGKTVALVGQSGSGKSTIANLLTRFYDIQEGGIYVDGHPITSVKAESLRKQIGLVTQESILFNDSIKNNLLIGKPDATDDEIWEALKIANAHDFVQDMADGIFTNIGESGGKLSGGQKQRLSIARAVLKNPPIMILDEATSALDTESERLVQDALEKMMLNRTSIVIAHRLSTIQKADLIVVMKKGKIVEQGTHAELLAREGAYARLVQLQTLEQ
ncbi:MAG: antibiotic ABC transporter ATP-binding protein [Flavobacterium sp. BFFFF2]|nr:MAG: antibiotic ABC transporter ATP-binding protein [Flavobacterium sp. BFFFF2]